MGNPVPHLILGNAVGAGSWTGTATELLTAAGITGVQPNQFTRKLVEHFYTVFAPQGIHYQSRRTSNTRLLCFTCDGDDGSDDDTGRSPLPSGTVPAGSERTGRSGGPSAARGRAPLPRGHRPDPGCPAAEGVIPGRHQDLAGAGQPAPGGGLRRRPFKKSYFFRSEDRISSKIRQPAFWFFEHTS